MTGVLQNQPFHLCQHSCNIFIICGFDILKKKIISENLAWSYYDHGVQKIQWLKWSYTMMLTLDSSMAESEHTKSKYIAFSEHTKSKYTALSEHTNKVHGFLRTYKEEVHSSLRTYKEEVHSSLRTYKEEVDSSLRTYKV